MKSIYSSFVVLLFLCCNVVAAQVPPPAVSDSIAVAATMVKDPVQQIHIGQFEAKFEQTTLGEIVNAIGHGAIDHSGDASESIYWLCYTLPSQRIWLISHGEMGGSDHTLTQVSAVTLSPNIDENASCPSLPKSFQPINFDFGWVGSERQSIIESLGQPSGATEDSLTFYYSGQKPGPYQGKVVDWDVIGYLEMKLENDTVISINASHVTSY
jgi:hypothetical protein